MAGHPRPGKSFIEMLDLILRNQRRPNDVFIRTNVAHDLIPTRFTPLLLRTAAS
jgi:hypothetical protein